MAAGLGKGLGGDSNNSSDGGTSGDGGDSGAIGLGAGNGAGFGIGAGLGGDGGHGGLAWGGDTIVVPVAGDGNGGDATGGNGGYGGAGGTVNFGDGGAGGDAGTWGSNNTGDTYVNGLSQAHADAAIDVTAFNQSIVMGANLMENLLSQTVVGGSYNVDHSDDV